MKKSLLLIVAALLGGSAWAQQVPATAEITVPQPPTQLLEGMSGEYNGSAVSNDKRQAPRRAVAQLPATVAELDWAVGATTHTARGIVTLSAVGSDSARVVNLWGLGDTLGAAVSLAEGTIAIKPGKIYDHSTYGPVWACYYDAATNTFSDTRDITGTIGTDGTITLQGWGVFVVTGNYRGGAFARYSGSTLPPTNAVMRDTLLNSSNTADRSQVLQYAVHIDSVAQNQVQIINFANTGAVVGAYLGTDGTVEIPSQRVATYATYGDFYCAATDWTSAARAQGSIVATGTSAGLSWGQWGWFSRTTTGLYARGYWGSAIEFGSPELITYPTLLPLDWSGEGTEASPHVITTAAQWLAMQQRVAAGESYQGKHIALGADISMASLPLAYRPVGTEEHPFEGTFSGGGHTISGLTISAGAEKYQGLFGYCGASSSISDLKLTGCSVTAYGDYTGTLAGYSLGSVAGVTVTASVVRQQASHAGGVMGGFDGSAATNLSFSGTVEGYGDNGGVIGEVRGGALSGLEAHGTVQASGIYSSTYVGLGGLVGGTLGRHDITIAGSYSDAMVTDKSGQAYTGGLVGDLSRATLTGSYNAGPVTAAPSMTSSPMTGETLYYGALGGLVGRSYGGTVADSYNANLVLSTGNSERVGGLVGHVGAPMRTYSDGRPVVLSYESRFTTCYNAGQVSAPTMHATQGIYGDTYSDTTLVNCYFDQQLTGNVMPDLSSPTIKLTAQLTGGTAPEGFSAQVWQCAAGLYPELKALASTAASKLSVAPVLLSGGENVRKVRTNFAVSTQNGVVWQLYDQTAAAFTDSTAGLVVRGDSVLVRNVNSSEMLVARLPGTDVQVKMVMLETVDPSAFSGSGTMSDPFLISDKDDLMKLNDGIVNNAQSYEGDYFVQTNDIDLNYADDFDGIGTDAVTSHFFAGNYNGQGYSIRRLKVAYVNEQNGSPVQSQSKRNCGFFGIIGEQGTVRNLTIAADCQFLGYNQMGAIAGTVNGTIDSCRNYAPVSAAVSYAAGIAATVGATGRVTHCYNAGAITATSSSAAGIACTNSGLVAACQNDGTVTAAKTQAAGITCYNTSAGSVTDCVNAGTVESGDATSGITGQLASGALERNLNYGVVICHDPVAGTLGAISANEGSDGKLMSDNFYDSQLGYMGAAGAAPYEGLHGLLTRELTTGQPVSGLDSTLLDYQPGRYPVLRQFASEPAAQAQRAMVITLPDGQTIDDVTTGAQLASAAKWALRQAESFALTTDSTLTATIAAGATGSLRDTLTANIGDYSRRLPLRTMASPFKGSGTEADPYLIADKTDMLTLARLTNDDNYAFTGRYFKVTADIDFDTTAYVPVAQRGHKFDGHFDGGGHRFLNINYTNTEKLSLYNMMGLFGTVGPNGVVTNLTLQSGSILSYGRGAGIVGKLWGTVAHCDNHATVGTTSAVGMAGIVSRAMWGSKTLQCRNYGSFSSSYSDVAGIAYEVKPGALVQDCENWADITWSRGYVGGIADLCAGRLERCVNHGNISASSYAGGIVAQSLEGDTLIDCANHGTITATSNTAGGIIATSKSGATTPTLVLRCANSASVSASANAGGIVGYSYIIGTIDSCANTAAITTTGKCAGGIVGKHSVSSGLATTVSHCSNSGTVTAGGGYGGGLVGDSYGDNFAVTDSYNTGDVTAQGLYAAGIAGTTYGTVARCVNYASVEGSSYVGGIAGYSKGTTVSHCVNLGNVNLTGGGTYAAAAGIAALQTAGTLTDCYNMGSVTSVNYAAGVCGDIRTSGDLILHISRCYNAGTVQGKDDDHTSHVASSRGYAVEADSLLYDLEVNPDLTPTRLDTAAIGLTTAQLTRTQLLGDAFALAPGMLPILTDVPDSTLIGWHAATVVLAEGSTAASVRGPFTVGAPEGTEWTAEPAGTIAFSGSTATPTALGTVVITKTCGTHQRSYELTVTALSGVTDIDAVSATPVSTAYYTISGQSLGHRQPTEPGLYVRRVTLSDGTTRSATIVLR